MASYIFQPASSHTARLTLTLGAELVGLPLTYELFLSKDGGATKAVTTGASAFTGAASQPFTSTITMPTVDGDYKAYIYIASGGTVVLAFVDSNDILIPTGSVTGITWS
jgi:hypothetical protein